MKTAISCSVAPMLSVRNGGRAVEFYKSAFGALEAYRMEAPDGAVVSRLSVEGTEFWLSDESPEHGNFSPETLGGSSVRLILTVPDPDAVFAAALTAGAREVFAVEEAHGWRLGRVVDPFGHHWEIGARLPRKTLSKKHREGDAMRRRRKHKAATTRRVIVSQPESEWKAVAIAFVIVAAPCLLPALDHAAYREWGMVLLYAIPCLCCCLFYSVLPRTYGIGAVIEMGVAAFLLAVLCALLTAIGARVYQNHHSKKVVSEETHVFLAQAALYAGAISGNGSQGGSQKRICERRNLGDGGGQSRT